MNTARFLLFTIIFAFLATIAATDILLPSLPNITLFFHSEGNTTQLAVPIYLLGSMLAATVWGIISDYHDRKRIMACGLFVFILGSIFTLMSWNIETFLIGRFIQGVGGVVVPVAGYALIHDLYPDDQSAKVISWLGTVTCMAPIVAPLLGGYLEEMYGWHASFYFLLIMIFIPFLVMAVVGKKSRIVSSRARTSLFEVLSTYGKIVTHKNFLLYVLVFAVLSSGEWCYVTVAPYYFQNTLHLSPETFGWYIFLSAAFYLGGTLFAANMMRWFSLHQLLWIGVSASLVASLIMLGVFVLNPTSPLLISLVFGVYLFGNAIVWGPSTSRALQSVQDFKGAASAVRSLFLTGFYTAGGFLGSLLPDDSLLGVSLVLSIGSFITVVILKRLSRQTRG